LDKKAINPDGYILSRLFQRIEQDLHLSQKGYGLVIVVRSPQYLAVDLRLLGTNVDPAGTGRILRSALKLAKQQAKDSF